MNMKKILPFLALLPIVIIASSCQSNTYANQLKAEKALIADYIKRNHINVIHEVPDQWGEKDYLDMTQFGYDNLYFHLVAQGDTASEAVTSGDKIVLRYRRYTLDLNPDTLSNWTTADSGYPVEFTFLTDNVNACQGWHAAVLMMTYNGAEAKIINPSKLGFSGTGKEQSTVTPYGYDLKIRIKR